MVGKTTPWQIPKRYRESEHRQNVAVVEGGILRETEAMFCAAQEQPVKLNSIKYHIEDQGISPMCRLCGELSETLMHLSSCCPVLAKSKYQIQHEIVGKHIHWLPSIGKYWE